MNDELVPSKPEHDKPKSAQSLRAQTAKMTAHPKNTSLRRFALGVSRESKPSISVAAKSYITPPNQWIPRAGTIKDPKRKSIRFQDPIEGILYTVYI